MEEFRFDIWLKQQLEKRNWTAVELATRAGVAPSTLTHAIRYRTYPTLRTILLVLEALNMHIEIVNNVQ